MRRGVSLLSVYYNVVVGLTTIELVLVSFVLREFITSIARHETYRHNLSPLVVRALKLTF